MRRLTTILATTTLTVACGGGVDGTEGAGPEPAVAEQGDDLLAASDLGYSGCSPAVATFLQNAHFVARTVVASDAYADCLYDRIVTSPPTLCSGDYSGSSSLHYALALYGTRSASELGLRCTSGLTTSLTEVKPGYDSDEIIELGSDVVSAATSGAIPSDLHFVAKELVGEALQAWGTAGPAGGTPFYHECAPSGLPQIVRQCVADVLSASETRCGGTCSSGITTCNTRARLRLVNDLAPSGTCVDAHDPGKPAVGALQLAPAAAPDVDRVVTVDQFPWGPRWGVGNFLTGWIYGQYDTLPAYRGGGFRRPGVGDLDPEIAGYEMLVQSNWGLGVLGWSLTSTSLPERTFSLGGVPFGTTVAALTTGGATWLYNTGSTVVGVGRFSASSAFWPGMLVRDEVLVRNSLGPIALLSNVKRTDGYREFRTDVVVNNGTSLPAGAGITPFVWNSATNVIALGDFDGDGQTDLVVRNATNLAVVTRSGSSLRTVDNAPMAGSYPVGFWVNGSVTWDIDSLDRVVAVGNFVGSSRAEILFRKSSGALGLVGMNPATSPPRLNVYANTPPATSISSVWTTAAADSFAAVGNFSSTTNDAVIMRGTSGLAPLRYTLSGAVATPAITASQRITTTGTFTEATGDVWYYSPSDTTPSDAVGDLDGDGYDELLIRSSWGSAIVGPTTTSPTFVLHSQQETDCGPLGTTCPGSLWGDWVVRPLDEALAVLPGVGAGARDSLLLRTTLPLPLNSPWITKVPTPAVAGSGPYWVCVDDVSYLSDGLLVYGRVYRPCMGGGTAVPPARSPLLMENHGGLTGISTHSDAIARKFASNGWVVGASSYRGEPIIPASGLMSGGVVETCKGEVNDVLRMMDILRTDSQVDATRVSMHGDSHGGCITLQALARGAGAYLDAAAVVEPMLGWALPLDNAIARSALPSAAQIAALPVALHIAVSQDDDISLLGLSCAFVAPAGYSAYHWQANAALTGRLPSSAPLPTCTPLPAFSGSTTPSGAHQVHVYDGIEHLWGWTGTGHANTYQSSSYDEGLDFIVARTL